MDEESYMKKMIQKFSVRKVILALSDAFIITVAMFMTFFLFDMIHGGYSYKRMFSALFVSLICCILSLFLTGAYSKLWRYFKKKDYLSCVYGMMIGYAVSGIIMQVLKGNVDVLFLATLTLISTFGICLFRFMFRDAFITLTETGRNEANIKRTMIIGGGQMCSMILTEIENAKNSPYTDDKVSSFFEPVCIIDDDRSKIGTKVNGVEVVGDTNEIKKFAEQKKVEQIIFAIPSCVEDERKRILDICSETNLPVKIVPFIGNLIFDESNNSFLKQIRDIRIEDLLGRDPVTFDNKDISSFISGKVCMVTGGGGSIGSELVRQIAKYSPKHIIIVDIYENNAYEIQQELIMEYGDDLHLTTLIASVRDYYRMNSIFEQFKPNIVFHAAAHKHVPLMEASPMEAIKNNVIGTLNTASLAQFHNVEKFVMISTDKAVNPTNAMGASKRCCEMLIQYLSQQKEGVTEFVTTRFGNVLGSNGSVIPLFRKQIEQGKPVTVTHPDIIRYFMTIPEAVSLVMEAAAIAEGGEIFVLDMGQPVRIVRLAENLIRMYGKVPYKDVEIKFTGLRPGEKIKEELLMDEEGLKTTSNKLIFIGKQIELDPDKFIKDLCTLRDAALTNDVEKAINALHDIVPTYITPEAFNRDVLDKESKKAS